MANLAQPGGITLLKNALTEYPLSHDLIIFDCPATLEYIPKSALVAADRLLIPLMPDAKAVDGTRVLLDWYAASVQELQLGNPPEFLGFGINAFPVSCPHVIKHADTKYFPSSVTILGLLMLGLRGFPYVFIAQPIQP